MGELEEANFEHAVTLTLSDNTTEGTTEGITEKTLNVNTISAKEDSKAKRIIYKHLSEVTWEKVEDIDTAYELWEYLKVYYCETDDKKIKKNTKRLLKN